MQSVLQFRLLIFFFAVCVFLICRGLNAPDTLAASHGGHSTQSSTRCRP